MRLGRGDFVYLSPLVNAEKTEYEQLMEAENIRPLSPERLAEQKNRFAPELSRLLTSRTTKSSILFIEFVASGILPVRLLRGPPGPVSIAGGRWPRCYTHDRFWCESPYVQDVASGPGGPHDRRRGPVAPVIGVPLKRSSRQGRMRSAGATGLIAQNSTRVRKTFVHPVGVDALMRPSGTRCTCANPSGGRRPPPITMEPSGLQSSTPARAAPRFSHGALRAPKQHTRYVAARLIHLNHHAV